MPTLALQNGADSCVSSACRRGTGQGPCRWLGLHFMGQAFGDVFLVATVLVGLCLVPAFFLPRKPPEHHTEEATQAAMMG